MKNQEFQVVKDWYAEWIRFPQYVTTAALASLAFSLTNFVSTEQTAFAAGIAIYLKASWILLITSAILSSLGMFFAFIAFQLGAQLRLKSLLTKLHIGSPSTDTYLVKRYSAAAWRLTALATISLLAGALSLVIFVWHNTFGFTNNSHQCEPSTVLNFLGRDQIKGN